VSETRAAIISQFKLVAEEQNKKLTRLDDDLVLFESGLDSLCLAVVIARLEDELGKDPFSTSEGVNFPVTLGDFIRLYERGDFIPGGTSEVSKIKMVDERIPQIQIRQIQSSDIDDVVELLSKGFPKRRPAYWRRALQHLSERKAPPLYPRFGYLLEHNQKKVGLVLLIFSERNIEGESFIFCNLSSWYVEPLYRGYAGLLNSKATRHSNVTYFNISADAHTWPMIEVQGFKSYCNGEMLAIPVLSPKALDAEVEEFEIDRDYGQVLGSEERELLITHIRCGCIALIVRQGAKFSPFLFMHRRSFRGLLPTLQLIYCRELQEFANYAGSIGRALLRRGGVFVRLDTPSPLPGVRGIHFSGHVSGHGRRYFRGPRPPRISDFTFTETIFFGF